MCASSCATSSMWFLSGREYRAAKSSSDLASGNLVSTRVVALTFSIPPTKKSWTVTCAYFS